MKKFFYAALAISAAAAFMASCTKEATDDNGSGNGQVTKLDKPVLTVEDQTASSFTVAWAEVENADSYTYTVNNGTEQTTTATSAEFTDLTPGDYTVKVKATSENSSYADSDWAITDVTIAEPVEETFTLDVYVTDDNASSTGYYSYNSIWFTAKGSGITAASYVCYNYQAGITDDDIIADIEKGGEYIFNLEADELALVLTAGLESGFVELSPESTYEIAFYVTFQSGNKKLYRGTATTAAAPEASEDIKAWVGTWNISSDKTFEWVDSGEQGYVNPQLSDTPKSGTLTIEYDPQYTGAVTITGLSGIKQLKDAGYDLTLGYVENGQLVLYNGIVLEQVAEGQTMGWYAYSQISYGEGQTGYSYVNGDYAAFTFNLSGNTATSVAGSGDVNLQSGETGTYTVLTYDVYVLYATGGMGIYHQTATKDASYAGTLTLTKTTSSVAPKQAKLFDKTAAARKSSLPSYSALKVSFPAQNM